MAKSKNRKKAKRVSLNPPLSPKNYIKKVARKLPVIATYMSEDILETGMGYAIVVREKRNGEKVAGVYLLDTWCMGVKDTFYRIVQDNDYKEFIDSLFESIPNPLIERDPNYVFNLIYGALEYADDLGVSPHKDFTITEYILEDIDSIRYVDIPFGKDGRPCYIAGPDDKVGKIIKTLNKSVGSEGFDYIIEDNEYEGSWQREELELHLSSDLDRTEFMSYLGVLVILHTIFVEDISRLMELYRNDHLNLQSEVTNNWNLVADDPIKAKPIPLDLVLPITEKYLIYRNPEFLYEEPIIVSFDSTLRESKDIPCFISNVILYQHGTVKLTKLFTALALIIAPEKPLKDQRNIIMEYKSRMRNDDDLIWEKEIYEVGQILEHIIFHEDTFGMITEDDMYIKSPELKKTFF